LAIGSDGIDVETTFAVWQLTLLLPAEDTFSPASDMLDTHTTNTNTDRNLILRIAHLLALRYAPVSPVASPVYCALGCLSSRKSAIFLCLISTARTQILG
jgi:uncharacterized membrane protein